MNVLTQIPFASRVIPSEAEWEPKHFTKPNHQMLTKGPIVELFAKTFLIAVRGTEEFKPIQMTEWQKWITNCIFELDCEERLRYNNVTIMIPRKNGKTFIAAIYAAYHLFTAPRGAEIYSAAGTRDQAKIVFDVIKNWVEMNPELGKIFHVMEHKSMIRNKITGAFYKALSADAGSAHGLAPYFVIMDEIHTWDGTSKNSRNRARELYNALTKGSADRLESQVISISTAGNAYDDSLLGELAKRGIKEIEKDYHGTYGFFCWAADEDDDIEDPETWRKANPSLSEGILVESKFKDAYDMAQETSPLTFKRDHLNIWADFNGEPYIQPKLWSASKVDKSKSVFDERRKITVGFDASKGGDSTAIVMADIETGQVKIWKLFEAPIGHVGKYNIKRKDVTQAMKELMSTHDVEVVWADQFYYEAEIDAWVEKYGWNIVKISQSGQRKDRYASEFRDDLYAGNAYHLDDSDMTRHISNVLDSGNGSFMKPDDRRKIDVFIGCILANSARKFVTNQPAVEKPKLIRLGR